MGISLKHIESFFWMSMWLVMIILFYTEEQYSILINNKQVLMIQSVK